MAQLDPKKIYSPMNKPQRRFFGFVMGIAGLIYLANLLVDNPYSHRLVRTFINEQVHEKTNLTLDFNALKVAVFPPGIDLYGVRIGTIGLGPRSQRDRERGPENQEAQDFISASHVEAHVSVWSIVIGAPRLRLVEATDLEVVWPSQVDLKAFLKNQKLAPPSETDEVLSWPIKMPILVERVVLRNARIHVEDPGAPTQVPLVPNTLKIGVSGLNLDIDMASWTNIDATCDASSVSVSIGSRIFLSETAVALTSEVRGRTISISRLTTKGSPLNANATGLAKIKTFAKSDTVESFDVNLDGDVDGDLSVLGAFLSLDDTKGAVRGHAAASIGIPIAINQKGDKVDPEKQPVTLSIIGEAKSAGAKLGGFGLQNCGTKFTIDKEKIIFDAIEIVVGETKVGDAKGELKFNNAVDFDFSGALNGLHLRDLLRTFDVDFDAFDFGMTTPNLRVRGRGEPFILTTVATVGTTDISLPSTPYDHKRFPFSPHCLLGLELAVNVRGLDFTGSKGECFQPQLATVGTGISPSPITAGLMAAANKIVVKAGDLQAPEGATARTSLRVGGNIFFDSQKGINMIVEAPLFDAGLGNYFAQIPLKGSGRDVTKISGPFDRVSIENRFDLKGFKVEEFVLGNAKGVVTAYGDRVVWNDFEARNDLGGVISSQIGTLFVKPQLAIKTQLTATEITPPLIDAALQGFMHAGEAAKATGTASSGIGFGIHRIDGNFEGPLLFPLAWKGEVEMDVEDVAWDGTFLIDRARANLQGVAEGWSIKNILVDLGELQARGQLQHKRTSDFSWSNSEERENSRDLWTKLGVSGRDKVDISITTGAPNERGFKRKLSDTTADHLQRLPFAGEILQRVGIKGQVVLTTKLEGDLNHLGGTLDGSIDNLSVFGSGMAPLGFRGFVNGSKLDLVMTNGGNAFEGRLSIDWLANGLPYEWYFNLNRMDLRALATDFFFGDARNYAYVSASWHMKGMFADWWRSQGDLVVKDVQARFVRDAAGQLRVVQVQSEQPTTLLFTQNGWHFRDDRELQLTGKFVNVRVSVPNCRPPEQLAIKIDTVIDMNVARELSPLVESASGKVHIVGQIAGSVEKLEPVFEVTDLPANPFISASWEPLSIGMADFRPPLQNVRMKLLVKNNQIVVDSFAAKKGAGTISASGALNLSEKAADESHVDITMREASVVYPVAVLKSFDTALSGSISISGHHAPWRVSGDINIAKARSTREVDIRNEIINAIRKQSISSRSVGDKPMVQLDLNVNADRSINISNRNIQAMLSSSLQVTGTDLSPVVTGQVEVVRGKFVYKRDFTVTRGLINFDDPVKPDPSLDILAVSEVKNYRVYITITGRASNPIAELTIDPPTNRNGSPINKLDILVLLTRGELPDENRAVGDAQNAVTTEAWSYAFAFIEEPVEKLIDLSGQKIIRQVYIDTYAAADGSPVPRFNLPLNLGEELDVVLRVDRDTLGLTSEYALHESVSISGGITRKSDDSTAADGSTTQKSRLADTGVDLRFRFAFP